MIRKILHICLFCICAQWSLLASAQSKSPTTVLTLTGQMQNYTEGSEYRWTLPMLEVLPQHTIKTMTPWTLQAVEYSGPLLRDVLKTVQAHGTQLVSKALNDYTVNIPLQDALTFDVIVATRMNGQAISVRQRGPLLVIYPFNNHPELRTSMYYDRSIWQLKAITIQ